MTIEQANEYFSSLPEGFAPAEELRAALTTDVQKVQFVGVAGTAGKTSCAANSPIFIRSVFIEIRRSGHPPIRPIEYRKKSRTVQIAVRLFVRQSETKSRRANRRDLPLSGRLQVTGYRTYLSL